MAIVRKSSSGKALQVVLSEDLPAGTVLQCALSPFLKSDKFVLLTILPMPASPDRFPRSKVYGQSGAVVVPGSSGLSLSEDSFSSGRRGVGSRRKVFSSKKVDL